MSDLSRSLSDLAGTWVVLETQVTIPAGASGQVLVADPMRWAWWVGTSQGNFTAFNAANFSTLASVGAATGFSPEVSAGFLSRNYRQWGALAQVAIFCFNPALGALPLTVITIGAQQ